MQNTLVVLDSNVIISSLLNVTGIASRIIELWRKKYFQVLMSPYILSEIRNTLRDKQLNQKYHLSPAKQARLLTQLYHSSNLIYPKEYHFKGLRDQKDNPILSLALAGNARYLVTGDSDLLTLAEHHYFSPLEILTPNLFLHEFMSSDDELIEYLEAREKS